MIIIRFLVTNARLTTHLSVSEQSEHRVREHPARDGGPQRGDQGAAGARVRRRRRGRAAARRARRAGTALSAFVLNSFDLPKRIKK